MSNCHVLTLILSNIKIWHWENYQEMSKTANYIQKLYSNKKMEICFKIRFQQWWTNPPDWNNKTFNVIVTKWDNRFKHRIHCQVRIFSVRTKEVRELTFNTLKFFYYLSHRIYNNKAVINFVLGISFLVQYLAKQE